MRATTSTYGSITRRGRCADARRSAGATPARWPRPSSSSISIGTPGATPTRRGCASAAWLGNYTAPRPRRAGARWTSAPCALRKPSGSTARPDAADALHRPRRRECAGPDGDGRAARARRAAERDASRLKSSGAPTSRVRSRARATSATITHGPVVSEAGRARGCRLEHAPVPRAHRVLRGLWRLRRAHHRPPPFVVGATGRQTAAHRQQRRHDDVPLSR